MILDSATIRGPVNLSADVCVVGAGTGGAVVARTLARAGLDVVVVEAGRAGGPGTNAIGPLERMREQGLQATADRGLEVRQGVLPGGSSELGSNLAWRAPTAIIEGWEARGLTMLGPGLLEAYEAIERRCPAGEASSAAPHPLEEAADRLGRPFRRLAGEARGDRRDREAPPPPRSVRTHWLDDADLAGARIVCGFHVDEVEADGDAVVRALSREEVPFPLRVRAPAVVFSAGAVHTPSMMLWSHLPDRHRQMGQGLRLQPSAPLVAGFDDPASGDSAPRFEIDLDDGEPPDARARNLTLPTWELARYLPLRGVELARTLADPGALATLMVTLRDRRSGWVVPMTGSHAVIRYELSPGDRRRLRRALEAGTQLLLEAGASRVWTSHAVPTCVTAASEVELVADRGYLPCDLSLLSTDPLGTCAAGEDPRDSVTGEGGRVHGLDGFYVADASLIPDAPGVPVGHTVAALALQVADAVSGDLGGAGG